ncbi:MAG: hypothetical protein KDN22_25300 [Verrucomicrobiae bacterium]|nr:hypothetical protein [Verrucomicrobiae bacterium]
MVRFGYWLDEPVSRRGDGGRGISLAITIADQVYRWIAGTLRARNVRFGSHFKLQQDLEAGLWMIDIHYYIASPFRRTVEFANEQIDVCLEGFPRL